MPLTAVLLSLLAFGATAPQVDSTLPPPLLVHVCAERDVAEDTLRRAVAVAERLLSDAGVATTWRTCDRQSSAANAARVAPDIVVLLWSRRLERERDRCGFADRRPPAVGTAVVSVRCLQEFTGRIARQAAYRSHPLLAGGRHDDILGVLVAHEIGHLLGLGHSEKGVMRTRLDAEDVIAFRLDRLRFTPEEAARLRAATRRSRSLRRGCWRRPTSCRSSSRRRSR